MGLPALIPGKFTVVITVFGREHLLAPALQSLVWQTYRPIEILIYSDGPAKDVLGTVASFDNAFASRGISTSYTERPFSGFYGNALRGLGVEQATGEYIYFLSHDCLLHPHALATHAAMQAGGPCVSVTGLDFWSPRLVATGKPGSAEYYDYITSPTLVSPLYYIQLPLRDNAGLAVVKPGDIDAHCCAYPTQILREIPNYEYFKNIHGADYSTFIAARAVLPIRTNLQRLAAHF